MDRIQVSIRNWEKFNARTDRANYTWFRMQNGFFQDQAVFPLSARQKILYLFLLCEASKSGKGELDLVVTYVAAMLQMTTACIGEDLSALMSAGVVEPSSGHHLVSSLPATDRQTDKTDRHTNSGAVALKSETLIAQEAWLDCLTFHKAQRPITAHEQTVLTRNIQARGLEAVMLAIGGLKHEPASETFKPSDHLSLTRLFDPQKFDRFMGLGAKAKNKTEAKRIYAVPQEEEIEQADPERVRAIMAQAFGGRASGTVGA